jgi:hypothetical protein
MQVDPEACLNTREGQLVNICGLPRVGGRGFNIVDVVMFDAPEEGNRG